MITNAKEIAITPAREKALEIVNAGYSAIEIEAVIADRISLKNDLLTIRFFAPIAFLEFSKHTRMPKPTPCQNR